MGNVRGACAGLLAVVVLSVVGRMGWATNLPVGATVTPETVTAADPLGSGESLSLRSMLVVVDPVTQGETVFGDLLSTVTKTGQSYEFTYRVVGPEGSVYPGVGQPNPVFPGITGSTLTFQVIPPTVVDVSVLAHAGGSLPEPGATRTNGTPADEIPYYSDVTLSGLGTGPAPLDASAAQVFVIQADTDGDDGYQEGQIKFVGGNGDTLLVKGFVPIVAADSNAPVPEPATLALLPMAVAALGWRFRRR